MATYDPMETEDVARRRTTGQAIFGISGSGIASGPRMKPLALQDQQEHLRQVMRRQGRPQPARPAAPPVSRPSMAALSGNTRGRTPGQQKRDLEKEYQAQGAYKNEERDQSRQAIESIISRFGNEPAPISRSSVAPDETAARAAAFARAKEQAAMTARASMSTLEDVSADQGWMGSSRAAGEAGRIVGGARADIHDFTREQLMSDLDRAREVSDMDYQGQVQQRGQTMGRQAAIMALLSRLY